ncbi:TPA: hypothetical protein ACT16M_001139 [Klebsiella pneumoniae]
MTKSTITRERAQQIFLGNGPEPSVSEERELARMALAAMDSEPVAEVYQTPNVGICAALGPSIRMLCALEPGTKLYRHAQPAPVVPDGYVMVPINMTTEQMRAVQRDSTLGTFASAHLKGAFDLYREFWSVAVAASTQEFRKSNVVGTYRGADGKEHEIIYLTSSQKELK